MVGRYTPVERLRRHFLEGFLEARLLTGGNVCSCLVPPISTTVGGSSWRWTAAGSGRAASTMTLVSGRWARGKRGQTIPDLDFRASPASRVGLVIDEPAVRPEKGLV